MNPSFGALVSYRRRALGLTQDQLGRRMAASGQAMDIALLERGAADLSHHATRTTLALALEWPIELVEVLHEEPSGAVMDLTAATPQIRDAVQLIREELVVLHMLRMTLHQWLDDLEGRVSNVLIESGPVRFDD